MTVIRLILALICGVIPAVGVAGAAASQDEIPRATVDPEGTGEFYLGREIAPVMGHQGAPWLERAERAEEERPDRVLELMGLEPGAQVADIGSGSGYYTRRIARVVGAGGKVYAVDIQPEMLAVLTNRLEIEGITNVIPILGSTFDPGLRDQSVDLVLMVDVYHEFSHPFEMVSALCRALKPGGRLVLVEYRAGDPDVPIKRLHTMTEAQVRKEMALHPLRWERTVSEGLPWQQYLEFRKLDDGNR